MTQIEKARLVPVRAPDRPVGAVLVLHGGAGRGAAAVSTWQLSVLRMVPVATHIARVGRGRLAVFRLLNSTRGWNEHRTPVEDVRWALGSLPERYGPDLPVGLVGHSLGGRAALLAAGSDPVTSVVALAPWVYEDDVAPYTGRRILFVHGDRDRIASPARSATVAAALARSNEVGYVSVRDGNHAMLGRHAPFTRLAARWTAATLLGDPAPPPLDELLAKGGRVEV